MSDQRHRIVIDAAFKLGDFVMLRAGGDERGMVTGYTVRPQGVIYSVSWNIKTEQPHYEIELRQVEEPVEVVSL